jgi:hypothetical protein
MMAMVARGTRSEININPCVGTADISLRLAQPLRACSRWLNGEGRPQLAASHCMLNVGAPVSISSIYIGSASGGISCTSSVPDRHPVR